MKSDEKNEWEHAFNKELNNLYNNKVMKLKEFQILLIINMLFQRNLKIQKLLV